MASFADSISQFRPYVQQLPLEAMAQVGMYKQQKYEEGVQKIQNQIDNIAGMDVLDKHKGYLQSKLNELGGKLKNVAAGDFSNFQLVNSVGGMTNQIVKDPVIQNALLSAKNLRKGQQDIETARKAGKSNPDNEDFFYNKLHNWNTDTNLMTPFNGEFKEYRDVDAKLRDLTSKLKENEFQIENPYMRDESGRTLYFSKDPKTGRQITSLDPSKGEKRLDLDMLSVKVKGLPAERILNNFYNSLDSNDVEQLRINSWAHYRGFGPERFEGDIKNAYKDKKEMQSQELINLSLQLQNPTISGVTKEKVQARINDINDAIKNQTLEKEMANDIQELQNPRNLEEFKYKLYTQTHLTNLAKDLANQSYIQERKTNPAEQADLARQRFQFDKVKENNDNLWKQRDYNLRVAEFSYKKLKDAADAQDQGYRITPGEWKTGEKPPAVSDLENDVATDAQSYSDFQSESAEILFPKSDNAYKNMTLDQKKKALDKLVSDYRQNPMMQLTPDQRDYLEENRTRGNQLTHTINALTNARNEELAFRKSYIDKNMKGQTVTAGGITFTGQDADDFNSTLEELQPPVTSVEQYFDKNAAESFYKTYKGGKLLPMWNAYRKSITPFVPMNADDRKLRDFSNTVEKLTGNVDNAATEHMSHFIATNSPKYTVQRAAINISDANKAKDLDEFLATKAAQYANLGAADVETMKNYSPTTTAKLRDAKGTSFVIEKSKNGTANVVLFGADGTTQIIPASQQEVATFFPKVAVTSAFSNIKDAIFNSESRTTNAGNTRFKPGSGSGAVNAMLSGFDLPQLQGSGYESKVRFDVEGNPKNTGNTMTDTYAVVMYVPDPNTGTWKGDYISGGYVSEADVMNVFSKVSNDAIFDAIKRFK